MTKDEIRAGIRAREKAFTEADRHAASILAQQAFLDSEDYRKAQRIGCYLSTRRDVDTRLILEQSLVDGKRIGAPRYDPISETWCHIQMHHPDACERGSWQVAEPLAGAPLAPLDLVLVPGRAFDRSGNRIGHGKGHYDRMLEGFEGRCVGLAFSWQILKQVPREPHDRPMDALFTECGALLVVS
jgi:5-formyltetrahydrofolate cyclo-ligase